MVVMESVFCLHDCSSENKPVQMHKLLIAGSNRCVCATVVVRILFQPNPTGSELFHSANENKQHFHSLPGHSDNWDKIIIYGTDAFLFILMGEYIKA
jgi:hypothetical protein